MDGGVAEFAHVLSRGVVGGLGPALALHPGLAPELDLVTGAGRENPLPLSLPQSGGPLALLVVLESLLHQGGGGGNTIPRTPLQAEAGTVLELPNLGDDAGEGAALPEGEAVVHGADLLLQFKLLPLLGRPSLAPAHQDLVGSEVAEAATALLVLEAGGHPDGVTRADSVGSASRHSRRGAGSAGDHLASGLGRFGAATAAIAAVGDALALAVVVIVVVVHRNSSAGSAGQGSFSRGAPRAPHSHYGWGWGRETFSVQPHRRPPQRSIERGGTQSR